MMDQVIDQLQGAGIKVDYSFVRLICSKFDGNDPSHAMVRAIVEQSFGAALLPVPVLESAEISHAAMRMMTVYELEKPIGTPKTHKRCKANADEAMGQIEALVRQGWAASTLRAKGISSMRHEGLSYSRWFCPCSILSAMQEALHGA